MRSPLLWNSSLVVLLIFSSLPVLQAKEREDIYNAKADARADIARALARAKRDNKRVLLQYGANWCGWCHKLHELFKSDSGIKKMLREEYIVVLVDYDQKKNRPIAEGYKAKINGIPYLTILDGDGKVVTNQETGALEIGSKHDPARVLAFLDKNKAPPLDAKKVYRAALARAQKEKRKILIHLGAPW